MPWWRPDHGKRAARPRADAIVTRTEGLAIGITPPTAGRSAGDLNARDRRGSCRWKKALTGIVEPLVDAMEKARRRTRRHGRRDRP
jgi:hypothetical protein